MRSRRCSGPGRPLGDTKVSGMKDMVDRREAAGIVTLIARHGKVVDVHASGYRDVESGAPMRTDTSSIAAGERFRAVTVTSSSSPGARRYESPVASSQRPAQPAITWSSSASFAVL